MFHIDDDALRFLSDKLREGGVGQDVVLRLLADEQGCELVPDQLRDWDRVYEFAGQPVVVTDPDTAGRLEDRRLTLSGSNVELTRHTSSAR